MDNQKKKILEWNYTFPLDAWWRKKYKIALFSKEHLEANQVDITLEYLEEELFKEMSERYVQRQKDKDKVVDFSRSMLKDRHTSEEMDTLFDDLDITSFNTDTTEVTDE